MNYKIDGTPSTPRVEFGKGYLRITGKSVPFVEQDFYQKVNYNLKTYENEPIQKIDIEINLTATNALSKKDIAGIFSFLEKMQQNGTTIQVNWHYRKDDEDIQELGEILKSMFNIRIDIHEG